MSATRGFIEHVALPVRDIGWHMRFFRAVFGMELREADGDVKLHIVRKGGEKVEITVPAK